MYLDKVEIHNFRLLEDVEFTFHRESTLIVGKNNSGKTSLNEIFRKIDNFIVLAFAGAFLSFTYCWCFIVPNYFVLHIQPLKYLASDIIFELILAASSFVSILFLYIPCRDIFIKFRIGKIDSKEEIIDIKYEDEE